MQEPKQSTVVRNAMRRFNDAMTIQKLEQQLARCRQFLEWLVDDEGDDDPRTAAKELLEELSVKMSPDDPVLAAEYWEADNQPPKQHEGDEFCGGPYAFR